MKRKKNRCWVLYNIVLTILIVGFMIISISYIKQQTKISRLKKQVSIEKARNFNIKREIEDKEDKIAGLKKRNLVLMNKISELTDE